MADILIAPFSNSDIRDWQPEGFARLIRRLVDSPLSQGRIRVIGAATQRLRACEIVRDAPSDLVCNDCGLLNWSQVEQAIREAACVIGNNSGIAHLSARLGAPTVCIFSGAHQRTEWRPVGFNVALLSRAIGCAPCHLHRAADCPYDKACLAEISPQAVFEAAGAIMHRVARARREACQLLLGGMAAPEQSMRGAVVA